jgi:hypothetical protein
MRSIKAEANLAIFVTSILSRTNATTKPEKIILQTGVRNLLFSFPRKEGRSLSRAIAKGNRLEAKMPELAIELIVITATTAVIIPRVGPWI